MKNLVLFLSLFVLSSCTCLNGSEQSTVGSTNSSKNVYDFDKMLNFDELEDEMVKMNIIDSIKPIPPHPLIDWVRIIGLPMANAYFAARRIVRTSWSGITALLKIKTAQKH